MFILAIAHTYRIVDSKNGLPAILPDLFHGIEISHRGIFSDMEMPYVVNPVYVKDLMSVLFDIPKEYIKQVGDSTIVVDEKRNCNIGKESSIRLLFTSEGICVRHRKEGVINIPYSTLVSESEVIRFNTKSVSEYLKKRTPQLFIITFILNLIVFIFNIVLSIFFLSFAAFIFRVGQNYNLKTILKIVSFALSPVAIERILSSLAGAKITWTWHVAFLISLVIVYRAKKYLSQLNDNTPSGER